MKIYLDDIRPAPPGWQQVRWPDEAITFLKTGNVSEISLDHDLGDDARGTGYDVLSWIEEAVATEDFDPPVMRVHTANPPARNRMLSALDSIRRLTECYCGAD